MKNHLSGAGILSFCFCAILLASCSGCGVAEEAKEPGTLGERLKQEHPAVNEPGKPVMYTVDIPVFRKVSSRLTLSRGKARKTYFIGVPGVQKMSFQVRNNNLGSVSLEEWRRNEPDNILLHIAPRGTGALEKIPAEQWKQVWPEKKDGEDGLPVRRLPVQIAPGTFLTVEVPLPFLKKYILSNPAGDSLAVRADLNLASAEADPLFFEIRVRKKGSRKVRELIFAD